MEAQTLDSLREVLSSKDYARLTQLCYYATAIYEKGILIIVNPEGVQVMGLSDDVPPGMIHLVEGPSLLDPESS